MSIVTAITSGPGTSGNTEAIVNAMIDGAMGLSTNIINLFHIDRLRFIDTGSESPVSDDLTEVVDAVKESDCVIFATPIIDGKHSEYVDMLIERIRRSFSETSDSKERKAFIVVTCPEEKDGRKAVSDITASITGLGFSVDSTIVYADKDAKCAKDDEYILAKAKRLGLSLRNTW